MKRLLSSIAISAAVVFAAPVWAQTNPSGGNGMGTPGPNPGGGGLLTPYSGGAPPASAPSGRMPMGGKKISSGNYIPPHRHHVTHMHTAHRVVHHQVAPRLTTGGTTAQLNREELMRIQSGGASTPSGPPPGGMPGPENPGAGGPAPMSPGAAPPPPH